MKNSFVFSLLLFQFIFSAKSDCQISWTYNLHRGNIFGNLGPNSGRALLESQDGNILFLLDSIDFLNVSRLKLIKHDPHGYEIWRRILPQTNSLKGVDLLELPDGRIVIVGETPNNGNLYWQVRSASGDFIAEYSYNLGGTPNHCLDAELSPSGNIVIAGYRTNGGTNPFGQLILLEVTPDGAVNWSIYQNNNFGTVGSDVVFLNDGTGLLGYYNQLSNTIGFKRFDASGNILASQDFPQIAGELMDVEALPSGGAMITHYQNGQTSNLAKISNNLQLEWTNLIGPGTPDFKIWNLADYPDGGCAGLADLGVQHWFRVDANGNLIWMKNSDDVEISPKHNTLYGEAIIVTSDNGILFSSSDMDHLTSDYAAFYYLTKTDENGQLIRNRVTFQAWIDTNGNCTADGAPGEGPWQNGAIYFDYFYSTGLILELDSLGRVTRNMAQYNYTPKMNSEFQGHFLPCEPFPMVQIHAYPDTFTVDTLFIVPNPPNSTLSGTVFIDLNQNDLFDPADSVMACAKLRINCNYPSFTTDILTDENGTYSIPAYQGSLYSIRLLTSLSNCTTPQNYYYVEVDNPSTIKDIPINCSAGQGTYGIFQGQVEFDATNDCLADDVGNAFNSWTVEISDGAGNSFSAPSDSQGIFSISLSSGTYSYGLVFQGDTLPVCNVPDTFSIGQDQCLYMDLMAQVPNCANPVVDVTANRFRPCFSSYIALKYCNSGSEPAYNSTIQVLLDPQLSFVQATLTPTAQSGDTVWFDLGTLEPFECGSIYITANLDCSAVLGQTHCVEATIYPAAPCAMPDPAWDGTNIELSSRCEQGQVIFTLRNTGTGSMSTPSSYIIIEDNVLLRPDEVLTYQLAAGADTSIVLPAMGATYRLETNQALGHPSGTLTAAWEEGCGANPSNNFSMGFVTQRPYGDEEPFYAVFCDESVGSYDPNLKKAFPKGVGPRHFIQNTAPLDYQILFQNTGTDTAYLVVLRDTLSPSLDPASLRPGPSSHPYTFALENGNVAVFTFENIDLVDSTTNAEGSIGFVQFNIAQTPDNPPGTAIENSAAIYFDFNEPIITPTVRHEIPSPVYYQISSLSLCAGSEWEGTIYTADAIVQDTVHFGIFDSVFVTMVNVLPTAASNVSATICSGESFAFGNESYAQTGVYNQVFAAQNGCDSTATLNLTVLPKVESEFSATICNGESFAFGNESYSQSGIYNQVFAAQNGCDSTATLSLTVLPALETETNATICAGETLAFGGGSYSQTGIYSLVFEAQNSCDSTATLNLTVLPLASLSINGTLCTGESLVINGTLYNANNPSGIEVLAGAGTNGCDSTININLSFLPNAFTDISATICEGDGYELNGQTYTAAGTYTQVLLGENDCDSTVQLSLTVLPLITEQVDTMVLPGTEVFGVVVNADTVFTQNYLDENGCVERTVSVQILTATRPGNQQLQRLAISPNPTSGSFTLSGTLTTRAHCGAKLLDAYGRTVLQCFENEWLVGEFSRKVDLQGVADGLYFLSFATDGERKVVKLVVGGR